MHYHETLIAYMFIRISLIYHYSCGIGQRMPCVSAGCSCKSCGRDSDDEDDDLDLV